MSEHTAETLREMFLSDIKQILRYCNRNTGTKEEALSLAGFMFLTLIDGTSSNGIPTPIDIVVTAHPEEEIEELLLDERRVVKKDTVINGDCYLHNLLGDIGLVPKTFYPAILDRYRKMIESNADKLGEGYFSASHLLSMLETLRDDLEQSLSKKHRWLGFVQGVLCTSGLTTVDAERDFTRGLFNGV